MAKNLVMGLGVVLLAVGVLGFFNNPVLGIFEVDVMHNIVHLATGLLAVVFASKGEASAKTFAKTFAVVYGLVTVLGFVWPNDEVLGFIHIDTADDWLHLALTLVFAYVGWGKTGQSGNM